MLHLKVLLSSNLFEQLMFYFMFEMGIFILLEMENIL